MADRDNNLGSRNGGSDENKDIDQESGGLSGKESDRGGLGEETGKQGGTSDTDLDREISSDESSREGGMSGSPGSSSPGGYTGGSSDDIDRDSGLNR